MKYKRLFKRLYGTEMNIVGWTIEELEFTLALDVDNECTILARKDEYLIRHKIEYIRGKGSIFVGRIVFRGTIKEAIKFIKNEMDKNN